MIDLIKRLWKSETPKIFRFVANLSLLIGIAGATLASLPENLMNYVPVPERYISFMITIGCAATWLLSHLNTTDKDLQRKVKHFLKLKRKTKIVKLNKNEK